MRGIVEHSNKVIGAHEAILEAIRGKRIEEATQLLETHLLEIRNRLQIFNEEQNKQGECDDH